MFQNFINWLRGLFGKQPKQTEQVFGGWIKDVEDIRDQIFVEKK